MMFIAIFLTLLGMYFLYMSSENIVRPNQQAISNHSAKNIIFCLEHVPLPYLLYVYVFLSKNLVFQLALSVGGSLQHL